jgi:hypothetical protein
MKQYLATLLVAMCAAIVTAVLPLPAHGRSAASADLSMPAVLYNKQSS